MKLLRRMLIFIFCFVCAFAQTTEGRVYTGGLDLDKVWGEFWESPKAHFLPDIEFPYEGCFKNSAKNHGIPLPLLIGISRGESGFGRTKVSSANAVGMMQIVWPATAMELGFSKKKELEDACRNIEAGAKHLRRRIREFGNIHHAIASYNYGSGNINRALRSKGRIQDGAEWYSGYIYGHTQFVLDNSSQKGDRRLVSLASVSGRRVSRAKYVGGRRARPKAVRVVARPFKAARTSIWGDDETFFSGGTKPAVVEAEVEVSFNEENSRVIRDLEAWASSFDEQQEASKPVTAPREEDAGVAEDSAHAPSASNGYVREDARKRYQAPSMQEILTSESYEDVQRVVFDVAAVAPEKQVEVFKAPKGGYRVSLIYNSQEEYEENQDWIQRYR